MIIVELKNVLLGPIQNTWAILDITPTSATFGSMMAKKFWMVMTWFSYLKLNSYRTLHWTDFRILNPTSLIVDLILLKFNTPGE